MPWNRRPRSAGIGAHHPVESVPAITWNTHLRILKAAGAITGEISGPRICYALNSAALEPLADFIGTLAAPSAAVCCVPDEKEIS